MLDYFSSAKVLGLTAIPTSEAYAFFNNNIIAKYTYDDSVVDGVNVPSRVYRIATDISTHGGTIKQGDKVAERAKTGGKAEVYKAPTTVEYDPVALDRSVITPDQIRKVITSYKDVIYTDLYPEREKSWEYIPKTLIFAKDDKHASAIVEMVKEVFGPEFEDGKVPENFV